VASPERAPLDRKKNGIFYTPTRATQILANWAIQTRDDSVLEPSFGGCGFLAAVLDRLEALGGVLPENLLCGADVDPDAFVFLAKLLSGNFPDARFLQSDFLKLTNLDFPTREFSVVIGNPPYVSLHNMEEEQRGRAMRLADAAGVDLSRKASLWAYFLLHSLSFLAVGGRMAWILPGSFVHADYSVSVRKVLQSAFHRCVAVQLEERLFVAEGTEENSVVLLCEGHGRGEGAEIELARAADLDELELIIGRWVGGDRAGVKWEGRAPLALLPESSRSLWDEIVARGNTRPLSAFVKIRIGIVTGANKFFVLSEQDAKANNLPSELLQPIIARFSQCRGLMLSHDDVLSNRESGSRCLLVDTRRVFAPEGPVAAYLNGYPQDARETNQTFAKRSIWHLAHDGLTPDGFLSCMQGDGPTLVLNNTDVTCTNTVHRIFFETEMDECKRKFLAISLQGTFTQLSAELEGRSYGSGARAIADELHVQLGLLQSKDVSSLTDALTQLRRSRRGSRPENPNV
jgi:hypothetical protein